MLFAGILFFLLSPGVLLTIPAGSKGLFASGQTSVLAAAVHAAVFVAALYLLTGVVEGFVSLSAPLNRAQTTPINGKVRGMKPVASCVGIPYGTPCKIFPRLDNSKESVGFCSSDNWCIASPLDQTIQTRNDAIKKTIFSTYTPSPPL